MSEAPQQTAQERALAERRVYEKARRDKLKAARAVAAAEAARAAALEPARPSSPLVAVAPASRAVEPARAAGPRAIPNRRGKRHVSPSSAATTAPTVSEPWVMIALCFCSTFACTTMANICAAYKAKARRVEVAASAAAPTVAVSRGKRHVSRSNFVFVRCGCRCSNLCVHTCNQLPTFVCCLGQSQTR